MIDNLQAAIARIRVREATSEIEIARAVGFVSGCDFAIEEFRKAFTSTPAGPHPDQDDMEMES